MPQPMYDFNPVGHITVETIGPPGQRTFFLQASQGLMVLTMVMEKEQAAALASAIDQLLEQVGVEDYVPGEFDLSLHTPVEPEFRIGQMGLGYEENLKRVVIIVEELLTDEEETEREPIVARFWMSRAQAKALSEHAAEVVAAGRPTCPLCGEPIDPTGHFCPRSNGHSHLN